ncbi:hypothetical protein NDU88_005355 [Pleurodeles waltl]|uniref:Endonuclease/exonuclease/phosphatase domain-containing protein n=1 Tax=Pleurodeles waltl TaxID=8319 RepID=A0AAV7UIP2_PLEWA|nr:hypothetical protein NDU88_005355 [Pleurodeles waltl]
MRRWRTKGKPVCARLRPSVPRPCPVPVPRGPRALLYTANDLHALNLGCSYICFQSTPKHTKGPFSCKACNFTCNLTIKLQHKATDNHLICNLLNTRSIHKHAIKLWDLLTSSSPEVAFLTETWINSASEPDIAITRPEGYKIARRDRSNKPGGGIAIVHKNTIRVSTSSHDTINSTDHLHFKIHINVNTTLRGTLVYRSKGPRPHLCSDIADTISTQALASTDYILLGDLNFHLENTNDINTTNLIDNLDNLGLKQLITSPTHTAGQTLDLIFSASNHVSFNHTTEPHWTDHRCIHFSFQKPVTHHLTTQPPSRYWNRISTEQLISTLAQAPPPRTPTQPPPTFING